MSRCPVDARKFRAGVNMTPSQIRAWHRDPRSKGASFAATRARSPALAKLREKATSSWTEADCRFARRVNSFNARMQGMVDKHGCTRKAVLALRNWARHPPRCKIPEE